MGPRSRRQKPPEAKADHAPDLPEECPSRNKFVMFKTGQMSRVSSWRMDGSGGGHGSDGQTSFATGRCVLSREVGTRAPVRPMDGVLSDMRALVTATRRLVRAATEEATRPARASGPLTEFSAWGGPGQTQDETHDDLLLESEDPGDIGDIEGDEPAERGPIHGIWIAVATFVPTFLTIFFGATYLAGPPVGSRFEAGQKGGPPAIVSVRASREAAAPIVSSGVSDKPPRVFSSPARETLGNAAVPAPTWVRGAAFPDRDSAESLAADIQHKGYPAKVRRDDIDTTAWVVWIAKHPGGRALSERRE